MNVLRGTGLQRNLLFVRDGDIGDNPELSRVHLRLTSSTCQIDPVNNAESARLANR